MDVDIGESPRRGCGCFGCLSSLFSMALTVGIGVVILGVVEQSHSGSDKAAIDAVNECSAVTEALGSPVTEAYGPPGCGEYEGGGGHATSHFTIRVKGPKGSGSLTYSAEHHGGPWTIHSAQVSTSGGSIQAVPCPASAEPSPSPSPRPSPRPRKRPRPRR